LTEKERQLVDEVFEGLEEYFSVMEKAEEFKSYLLRDENFPEMCEKQYRKGGDNTTFELAICIEYDMWINESMVWPVRVPLRINGNIGKTADDGMTKGE
jgi:hypothetical protein